MRAVVTVVGSDKIGIVAGITASLEELKANIVDISQTILGDNFTMMMMVEVPENANFTTFKENLVQKGENLGVTVHVQNQAIFDAMHKL